MLGTDDLPPPPDGTGQGQEASACHPAQPRPRTARGPCRRSRQKRGRESARVCSASPEQPLTRPGGADTGAHRPQVPPEPPPCPAPTQTCPQPQLCVPVLREPLWAASSGHRTSGTQQPVSLNYGSWCSCCGHSLSDC